MFFMPLLLLLLLLPGFQMKKEDCTFTAPFEIACTSNDFIHALVVYFDVSFGASHKACGFTTHPKARNTHWKQTVFYLDQPITCCEGERLFGTISTTCVAWLCALRLIFALQSSYLLREEGPGKLV